MRQLGTVVACAASLVGGAAPAVAAGPTLTVTPRVALADVPVEIAVTGLSPGAPAQLRQSATDYAGRHWTGNVRVRADARGRVELRGNAAMRVLWSMQLAGGSPSHVDQRLDFTVRVDLVAGGHVVDGVTLKRRELAPGERAESVSLGQAGFVGEAFMPPASAGGKHPGVLVFGGSEGGLHVEEYAALFAAHGYPSVAIAYFGEPGLPKNLVRIPLEYFAGALHWLARRPGVDPDRLVVLGVSRGSEAAQLLGVHYPDLVHGVVALVPSNTPNCGIPPFNGAPARCIGPAWTFRGRAIPYNHEAASPDATPQIPDEQIDGPIFLDCGGEDDLWLSCPMAHAIVDRLREHHFAHAVTLLDYPRAGHAVGGLVPYDPYSVPFPVGGGSIDANERAQADGWPRLLAFLHSL